MQRRSGIAERVAEPVAACNPGRRLAAPGTFY